MPNRQTAVATPKRWRLMSATFLILAAVSLIASPNVAKAAYGKAVIPTAASQPSTADVNFANDVNESGDQTYPTVYAGDDLLSNGQTVIYIAPGDSATLVADIESLSASLNASYAILSVPRSYSELNALSSAVAKSLPQLTAAGLQLSSWAENPSTGTVDVSLATLSPDISLVQADNTASSIVSPAVRIVDTNAGPVTLDASRYHDTQPYFGGDNIQSGTEECTDGFEVEVGTTPVMLSAGHCGSATWKNGTTSNEIGVTGQLHFGDNVHDVQTIKNESYFADVWNGASGVAAIGVAVHGGFTDYVSAGQLITFDGSVTREVRDDKVDQSGDGVCITSEGDTICHLIEANLDSQSGTQACQPGDSGGPVYEYTFGNGTQVEAAGLVEASSSQFCFATELATDLSVTGSTLMTS
jgi:hypothetical protein